MSRRLFTPTFIALLLVYAAVAILALTSAEWYKSAMTPSGPVRVGVLDYYPPFSFRDGSARRGFDVDIAGAICLRMNRPCEFVPLSFVDLMPALQDGRIDAIVAGLNDTARRNRSAAFSTPYYRFAQLLHLEASLGDGPRPRQDRGASHRRDEELPAEDGP